MVTIDDVAKKSGYSTSTVSRALNDSGVIPIKTRNKIKNIAADMGYFPNALAKGLKTGKSNNIGVVSFIDQRLGFSHYLFASIFDSFVKLVEKDNYDITLISPRFLEEGNDLLGHCLGRKLDGVLILCADSKNEQVKSLIKSKLPVVVIDSFDEDIAASTYFITSDNRAKMFELTDYVLSQGHKNIVYITGQDIFVTHERIKGFKAALKANNIDFQDDMIVCSRYYNYDDFNGKLEAVLRSSPRPSCILVPDDYSAVSAYEIIKNNGLVVGKDISLAGFDGLAMAQQISPKLTTVYQDVVKMGESAATALLGAINGKSGDFLKVVPAKLVKGESVALLK